MPDGSLHDALSLLSGQIPHRSIVDRARTLSRLYRQERYTERGGRPLLSVRENALAYAAVRMPATHAAIRAALQAASPLLHAAPATHVDLGGGTGAALWAVAQIWPHVRSCEIERSGAAITVGRMLAERATARCIRSAAWVQQDLADPDCRPEADLVTATYVLGELPPRVRTGLIDRLSAAGSVLLVEPGTPAGYERIMVARDRLLAAGMRIVAPCPHGLRCPLRGGTDWCHFGARLVRGRTQQRAKSAERNFEDEAYCYLVATNRGSDPVTGRVIRRPGYAKHQVRLTVCDRTPPAVRKVIVPRRDPRYRRARDIAWGESWPPGDEPEDRAHSEPTRGDDRFGS